MMNKIYNSEVSSNWFFGRHLKRPNLSCFYKHTHTQKIHTVYQNVMCSQTCIGQDLEKEYIPHNDSKLNF
uniref:Uncharacterized protein n=1 Tax=Anguilla anguilla TaxID=7936 RepID=A0A0E9RKZ4_ANGAN